MSHISTVRRVSSVSLVPPTEPTTIYDRSLIRKRQEVSFSAFAYIFSEAVQYSQSKVSGVSELETKLNRLGFHVGSRMLELIVLREGPKLAKRETRIMGILQFVHTQVWRSLFGKPADSMQVSTDEKLQYMIVDHDPMLTRFISVPKDMPGLSCAALVAGMVEGVFTSAGFPAKVTAHNMETDDYPNRNVYVVKFDESVQRLK